MTNPGEPETKSERARQSTQEIVAEAGRLRFDPFCGPARDVTISLLIAPGS